MEKIKIGIPKALFYYDKGQFIKTFLENLNYEVVLSPDTNKEIKELGDKYSNDEMCSSLKLFLGHVAYLKDKCDYILNIREDNEGVFNQGCTNYLSTYDLINNVFEIKLLNINIDEEGKKTFYKELVKEFSKHGFSKKELRKAYISASVKTSKELKKLVIENTNKLYTSNTKVLLVGHAYNLYDEFIGVPIQNILKQHNIEIIYSSLFDNEKVIILSKNISENLYWKHSKECVGAVELAKNDVDGIIFLSSFPCGPDSLVNELLFRKLSLPFLNIIVDDINSMTGIETRIESFVDIIEQKI